MTSATAPRRILLATTNRHKAKELSALLSAALSAIPLSFATLHKLPNLPIIAETGSTFLANAILKARASYAALVRHKLSSVYWGIISDDSGLSVSALGGAPGVHSARYAGAKASDAANCTKLLKALSPYPMAQARRAAFVTTLILLYNPKPQAAPVLISASGRVQGHINKAPRGTNGFGYDPLFIPAAHNPTENERTFAEFTASEKNHHSHRQAALHTLIPVLKQLLAATPASCAH